MRLPRRGLSLPVAAALVVLAAPPTLAEKPYPRVVPIVQGESAPLGRATIQAIPRGRLPAPAGFPGGARALQGPAHACSLMGHWGAEDASVDFIYPPDDAFYTLIQVRDCASCNVADSAFISKVRVSIDFRRPCPMPIAIGFVGVAGAAPCWTPNPTHIIYSREGFDLPPVPSPPDTVVDVEFTLSSPALIVHRAFLVVSYLDTVTGCSTPTTRPLVVLGSNSLNCRECVSYNDWEFDEALEDLCAPAGTGDRVGNPRIWAQFDSCFPTEDLVGPGRVTDLRPDSVASDAVKLVWTASGGDTSAGQASAYDARRSTFLLNEASFASADSIPGVPLPAPSGTRQSVLVAGLTENTTYHFAIKARDRGGNVSAISNVVTLTTPFSGPLANRRGPAVLPMAQPSRVPVEIHWVATETNTGQQAIRIYDLGGRRVRTLFVGAAARGVVPWNGLDDDGEEVPAGIYVARFSSGSGAASARIVLIR